MDNPNKNFDVTGDFITDMTRVNNAEFYGNQEQALKIRKAYKQQIDVKAIELIIRSTELGNAYREKVNGAFELFEKRIINIYEYNEILNKAHKEVYGY